MATAKQIMLDGPIGASAFNNEFGRPAICGYFRTFEMDVNGRRRGYHKPIMLAGGIGNIQSQHIDKNPIPPGSLLIVLGGPAMLIGLGGGAASSMAAGQSHEALDFASVQRGNPEMQRRCDGSDRGGRFHIGAILAADPSLSPLEMWCNESQERYVLAIAQDNLPLFQALCERERCPFAVVGDALAEQHLSLSDADKSLIDMPLSVLFGNPKSVVSYQLSVTRYQERVISL